MENSYNYTQKCRFTFSAQLEVLSPGCSLKSIIREREGRFGIQANILVLLIFTFGWVSSFLFSHPGTRKPGTSWHPCRRPGKDGDGPPQGSCWGHAVREDDGAGRNRSEELALSRTLVQQYFRRRRKKIRSLKPSKNTFLISALKGCQELLSLFLWQTRCV